MISSKVFDSLIRDIVEEYNNSIEYENIVEIKKPRKLRERVEAGVMEYLLKMDNVEMWVNDSADCFKIKKRWEE